MRSNDLMRRGSEVDGLINDKMDEIGQFLIEVFPYYREAMYLGNEPAGKGHEHIDGGYCDRWDCRWGGGEIYNGQIINASFSLNRKVNIHIVGNSLWVVDIRYAGKSDFWEYCVNCSGMPGYPCFNESSRHTLEPERLEKYLHTVIPNCKFWDMVQKCALELCGTVGDCPNCGARMEGGRKED